MRRRLLFLALLVSASCGEPARPGFPPRHVLLVSVASMRPDHMSAYLYPRPTTAWPTTPQQRADGRAVSIDDLAASGVVFAHAYAPAPSPAPSAASLLTGLDPPRHGVLAPGDALEPGLPTLAEAFSAAGFDTAAFVAGTELRDTSGLERGFARFEAGLSDAEVIARAVSWTEQDFGDGRGRFLWLHLEGPSAPYEPGSVPERPDGKPGPLDCAKAYADPDYHGPADGSAAFLARAEREAELLGPADEKHVGDLYDGEITYSAHLLRRYLLFLKTRTAPQGVWDETLVVFVGLCGEELGERGRFGRGGALTEALLRVPLFLRHPASLTGSRVLGETVGVADVAPTLCDWFGLQPLGSSGRSLLALTDSYVERDFAPKPALSFLVGADGTPSALSVTDGAWRATWTSGGARLFHTARDPAERRDRSADEAERLADLAASAASGLDALGAAGRPWRALVEPAP